MRLYERHSAPQHGETSRPSLPSASAAPPHPELSQLTEAADPFLSERLREQPAAREEAARVVLATLLFIATNAFFIVLTQLRDLPPYQVRGLIGGFVYGVGLLALLRTTTRHRLAGTLLMAGALGVLVFQAVVDLGISNPALVLSVVVPLAAGVVLGRSHALLFSGVVGAIYVGLYVAHAAGWTVPFRATDEDLRVYLVVVYCFTGVPLGLVGFAYAQLHAERAGLLRDRHQHREQLDEAVAAATEEARLDARRYRDRLREVLYATRLEASVLAGADATGTDPHEGALRLIRLANAHEAFLALEGRTPKPEPVRPSALVKRVLADVAAGVPPSSNVQFWVQREGIADGEPWPAAAGEGREDDRLTAPEAPVLADGALLYWSLRLALEYTADAGPHGHVVVTLHRTEGERASGVALSVHGTNSAAADVRGDLGLLPAGRADSPARDLRLSLARTLVEQAGGRLDVLAPRAAGAASTDGAGDVAWLNAEDDLVLYVELPEVQPTAAYAEVAAAGPDAPRPR